MSWLRPDAAAPTGYDPDKRVAAFVCKHGIVGHIVLEAWNEVDPLRCLYAPDEYIGYAERFMEGLHNAHRMAPETLARPDNIGQLVRRSFHAGQLRCDPVLGRAWVSHGARRRITRLITEQVRVRFEC